MNSLRSTIMKIRWRPSTVQSVMLVILLLVSPTFAGTCSACRGGEPMAWPEKNIIVEGLPIEDCSVLEVVATSSDLGDPLCDTIQDVGTLCGCNVPEGACTLCQDGSKVTNPDAELDDFLAMDYLLGAPEGVLLTCELLEALLHSKEGDSGFCLESQTQVYERCGCPKPQVSDNIFNRTDVPEKTDPPKSFCTVCVDGDPMTLPDKPMHLPDYYVESCADLNGFAAFYFSDSLECAGIQALGSMCGCTYKRNECNLCANGEPAPYPNKQLPWLRDVISVVPEAFRLVQNYLTCEMYEALLHNIEDNTLSLDADLLCLGGQVKSGFCGCSYDWRPILLVWAVRVSGILSMLGSAYIIFDILKSRRKRKATYHQLVLGISAYDCVSSFAYALATVMVPEDTGLYGAVGNETTCAMQGTMIQLGLTSVFYNALLSVYFLLMVNYNWREERFQKHKLMVHIPINVLGIGMAFGAIPYYFPQLAVCYIVQPPVARNWIPLSIFYTAPVILSLVILGLSTTVICVKVFRQEKAVAKYTTRKNRNLSRKVFWQSFWYVMSFMITFPLLIVSYFIEFRSFDDSYALFLVAGFLAPLQGTLNAFVYFNRSSKGSWLSCCSCRCCPSYRDDKTSSTASLSFENSPVGGTASAVELYSRASRIHRSTRQSRYSEANKVQMQSQKEPSHMSEVSISCDALADDASDSAEGSHAGVREFWHLVLDSDSLEEEEEDVLRHSSWGEAKLLRFLRGRSSISESADGNGSKNEMWDDNSSEKPVAEK